MTAVALLGALTTALADTPVTMTITFKDNTVVTHEAATMDSVRYVGGKFESAGGVGMKIYLKTATGTGITRVSIDYLYSQITSITYGTSGGDDEDDNNKNRNIKTTADYTAMPTSWRLEYPHLGSGNYVYSVPSTNYGGGDLLTYTAEWDCDKKSNHWTCYQFHAGTPDNNVGRYSGDFFVDPNLSSSYQNTHDDYTNSGYSRGHMCMSDDRQYSSDANKQTFYTTNIHPQMQTHNGGLWLKLEKWVNTRGYSRSFCDTLYVVKAGTIDKTDQVNGYTNSSKTSNHVLIPKYFYMAILALKDGEYKAIGFWTEHEPNDETQNSKSDLFEYAVTIDELEEKTGLDFFCNLPDDIEAAVQASFNKSDWDLP